MADAPTGVPAVQTRRIDLAFCFAEDLTDEAARGVFSCGSLGCPYPLYKKRGDTWIEFGAINADDAPGIEVLPKEDDSYSTLRGGCTGLRPCSELTRYDEWKADRCERSWIDFKGHPVDVAPSGVREDVVVGEAMDYADVVLQLLYGHWQLIELQSKHVVF